MISSLSTRLQHAASSFFSQPLAGTAQIARRYIVSPAESQNVQSQANAMFSSIFFSDIVVPKNTIHLRSLEGTVDTSTLYTKKQVQIIQVTACVVAGVSMVGSLLSLYWFSRMKKKFRHNLIIILIIGDLLRSIFLFVFPLVSLTRGHVMSTDPFCQASGYLTQTGIETADLAILLIALHTLLQIFKPKIGSYGELDNGLYRYRVAVYVIAAVLPAGWSALAFTKHKPSYLSQGPTCSLPLRPYWYRLAISWIPRYVIMITVVVMYIVIYIYVGRQNGTFTFFGLFKQHRPWETVVASTKDSSAPPHSSRKASVPGSRKMSRTKLRVDTSGLHSDALSPTEPVFLTSVLDEVATVDSARKISDGTTLVSYASLDFSHAKPILIAPHYGHHEQPTVVDLDGSYDDMVERKKSVLSRVSERFTRSPTSPTGSVQAPSCSPEQQIIGKKIMTKHMQKRQEAIQRQLGLLFLYPLCYFITYIPPFVAHAMNYTDYYVQHPIYSLNILSFVCLASLGWVDALVFSLRERPWRYIGGSDGTFLGSFRFWDNKNTRRTSDESAVGSHEMDTGATGSCRESRPVSHHNELMHSRDHVLHQQSSTPEQRDSWIIAAQPIVSPGQMHFEPRSLRVPSWSHFRSNSVVLAAPIMEEGEEVHHTSSPSGIYTPTSQLPLRSAAVNPGATSPHSPLTNHHDVRGSRWGSMNSTGISTVNSIGSDESTDRELANLDRMIDQAVLREWNRPDR